MHERLLIATIALAAVATPLSVAAQPAVSPTDEIERIQQRLMQTEQQVLAGEDMQTARAGFVEVMVVALNRLYPGLDETATSRAAIALEEVAEAREAGDNMRLHEIAAEMERLQAELAAAREHAMSEPDVVEAFEEFRTLLIGRMTEVDPETPALIARLEELNERDG